MSDHDFTHASEIADQAELELAIYLRAAQKCLGFRDPLHTGHIWIDTLESIEWPSREHEKLFRRVTILAMLQLFRNATETSVMPTRTSSVPLTAGERPEQESIHLHHSQRAKEFLCRN